MSMSIYDRLKTGISLEERTVLEGRIFNDRGFGHEPELVEHARLSLIQLITRILAFLHHCSELLLAEALCAFLHLL